MKTFIKKFQKKDKDNQVREDEVPLMMSYKDLEVCLLETKKEYQVLRSAAKDELGVKNLLNQEIEVTKALKLLWEETAANTSKYHLRMMGYDISDEGSGIAIELMKSGYNEVESASYIAMVTMALDIKNAGKDMELLTSFVPHAHALLDLLKKYRDENKMNEDVWKNNSKAIFKISYLDEHTKSWIEKILTSDDSVKGLRLSNSRILRKY